MISARTDLLRSVDGSNDISYTYDPAERLTDVRVTGSGSALETFIGGLGGRISHRDTTWSGQSARQKVSWTDLGGVASLTYPQISGVGPSRTICSSYASGFLVGVTDAGAGSCPGGTSLALVSYHPNGMVYQVGHGNDVTDTYDKDPNDMGRPYRIQSANAVSNWDSGRFEYDGAGNIKALRGMLEPVARPAPTRQQYTYDAFSNLQRIDLNGVTYQDLATSTSTNRLSTAGFDASGNMTTWGGYTYGYDPVNAMATLQATGIKRQHLYDAEGERGAVKDVNNPTTPVTTLSLRGLDGKVLREYVLAGSAWSWGKDYVYRNGQLLAAIDATGTKHFTLDHLGSPRLITDASRNVVEYHAYWGYGQEIDTACGSERMKFTGHERDNQCSAGALDYMHARYYNPTIGRFVSVDPARDPSPGSTQSWHLYAYARNNPLLMVDPTGESSLLFDGASHTVELRASNGTLVGRWPAYNNVQRTNPSGKWENGTYTMLDTSAPNMHPGRPAADTAGGEYGTNGILRAEPFSESNGATRVGMGLHAGREGNPDQAGRTGAAHATDGCVRTTGGAMTTIVRTIAMDPLTTISVTNNKAPVPPPAPGPQPTPPPEGNGRRAEDPMEHPHV